MSANAEAFKSLSQFSADLRRLPRVLAQKVAAASASAITALALQTFNAGENPWGNAWDPGEDGKRVTLKKSGSLARQIRYVAIGTKLRVALGEPYAKYQIGKRPVFPTQGGELPTAYVETLQRVAANVVREEMRGAA